MLRFVKKINLTNKNFYYMFLNSRRRCVMQIKFSQSIEPMVKKLGRSGTEVGKDMRYTLND